MTCQGTDLQNSQEQLGLSVLLKDTLTCAQEELESEPQTVWLMDKSPEPQMHVRI